MNGASPDPSQPAREPDAVARLQLTQALQRAQYAIAWERAWPGLARILSVVGLFLVASWAGLWLALPFLARAIGIGLFALAALAALFPLSRFRWPTREEALSRLDRGTGIRHRPATALTDTLSTKDPIAQALWREQRERTLASIKRIRAGLPSPRLPIHDPWALRALVMVMLAAAYVAAGDERTLRIAAAFDWNGVLAPANVRVDAWVTPPVYTGKPPVILSAARDAALPDSGAPLPVPVRQHAAGALQRRRHRRRGRRRRDRGRAERAGAKGHQRTAFQDHGRRHRACPRAVRPAAVEVCRHARPCADHFTGQGPGTPGPRLAADVLQARGRLRRHRSARAIRRPQPPMRPRKANKETNKEGKDGKNKEADKAEPRPLFEPPQFPLVLPNARTRNGVGQTVKDLSEDPYAGADVTLTLTAKDEAGNEGKSEPFNMRLPERLFTKPLARALIEQRRVLALDANQNSQVYTALDALMIAPELFTPEAGHYLGLYSISRQIEAARKDDAMRKLMASAWSLDLGLYSIVRQLDAVRTDDALREVVASLWALAVTIEDGNISDVDKALRAAQEALKQALERGATDEEIKKLTDNLRAALDNFLRQLAEQFRNNPQQLARPLDPNTKMLSQQDLKSMLDRLERMSRSGDKDAAKQLLEQLQQMLENLQMAQPGQGGDDMEQALNELGDMIRKQQQLRDKTYKQGQDSRRERQRGKQGDQSMGDLQQDQQGLRDRLKKLQEELAKRGMGPGQRGQQGQQGQRGEQGQGQQGQGQQGQGGDQGDGEDGLDQADNAMGDATGRLGEGNADGAVDSQGRALEALRKGAQSLAEAMQQGDGDQPGDGPGNPRGRQQGAANSTDPLGRPMRHNEFSDDYTVKIPGEIDVQRVRRILEELRRRLADPSRPQIELDYIERLLKDY